MFLKPLGVKVILAGATGLAFLLIGSLWDLYGNLAERWHRHEVLANGKEAMALVRASSGLQSVILSWTDFDGRPRMGEAWTRKQVSVDRRFVGERIAIKYLVDSPLQPVILSEVEDRERANRFWIFDLWIASVILVGYALVAVQCLRHGSRRS